MTLADVLGRVTAALDTAAVPYMVSGSVAGSVHGLARMTHDVDVVIDPTPRTLDLFVDGLDPAAYYVDRDAARDALARRSMFNVIDLATGWKVDCIVRKAREFSVGELARRREAVLGGTLFMVASPEDVILSKLEWAKASGSERQLEDVAGILAVCGESLDRGYVDQWIQALDLEEVWRRVPGT